LDSVEMQLEEFDMSTRLTRYAVYLLGIVAINTAFQDAQANAITQITASADWTSFIATLDGQSINFDYGQSSISGARAEYVDNAGTAVSDSASGWGDTDALSSIPNAVGHGYTSANSLNADGTGIADGITNTYGRGTATAYRIGYFSALAAGDPENSHTLVVSLTFDIAEMFNYDLLTDAVGAYSYYAIGLYYIDSEGRTTGIEGDNDVFSHYGNPGSTDCNGDCNGTWTLTPTLSISQEISGGRVYALDAFLYTDANAGTPAVIPEPSTLGLLALGLVGFAVSRHRKTV
jgi:hypothetical protein